MPSTVPLASTRYAWRFGRPSFGERLLEAFAAIGVDASDMATYEVPPRSGPAAVIEVVDLTTGGCLLRRFDRTEVVDALRRAIAVDLERFDADSFAWLWGFAADTSKRRVY